MEARRPTVTHGRASQGGPASLARPQLFRLRMCFSAPRLLPHAAIFLACRSRVLLEADMRRWASLLHLGNPQSAADFLRVFVYLMTFTPEFRNLFYLRAGTWSRLVSPLCQRLPTLDIAPTEIGPGLFIQHGEGTYVSARRIGENCWIGRQVVVGYAGEDQYPTIGDNVRIFAGAKIIGDVMIGDGATIGLNTVITDDVPAGATMLGVPGRIIWRNKPAAAAVPADAPAAQHPAQAPAQVL
jgi:serine O-acetyltransferase